MSPSGSADRLSYAEVGIRDTSGEDSASGGLLAFVKSTFEFRPAMAKPLLDLGYFANVLDLGRGLGLAISTDGVGTKLLIAQMLDKYDTVGIDCVAMNVNDVLCVGAEPVAMTDYMAVEVADRGWLAELGKGLLEGARQANISIPGGEIAQIPEMMRGINPDRGFDLVGTCVGTVPTDRILVGKQIKPNDVVIGLASSGIHSNGLTLARRALLDRAGMRITDYVPEFQRTVGEELLEPTLIYVRFALDCLQADLPVKAFIHITSDGFLNLTRVKAEVGYVLDDLLDVHPVFDVIQRSGQIEDEEMFLVFNMGIGFCAVVAPEAADRVLALARKRDYRAKVIGRTIADPERNVHIVPRRLVGRHRAFHRS